MSFLTMASHWKGNNRVVGWFALGIVFMTFQYVHLQPAPPNDVSIQSISVSNVTVNVTLSNTTYDGIRLYLYNGTEPSLVWFGSSPVSPLTVNDSETKTITIDKQNTALTAGVQYTVKVQTRSGNVYSDPVSAAEPATVMPSVPTLTSVVESSGNIEVTWTPGSGRADKFIVDVQPSVPGSPFNQSVSVPDNPQQQNITISQGLVKGETYTVKVRAESNGVASQNSDNKSVTLKPATPTGVTITLISTGSVKVNITLSAGRYNGIQMDLNSNEGVTSESSGSANLSVIYTVPGGKVETFTITPSPNLTPGVQYTVIVRTKSGSVYSEPSSPSFARVKPATLAGVTINAISTSSVTVTVSLSAGRYDGIHMILNSNEGVTTPASSGSVNVTAETVPGEKLETFTITPSPNLTPGVQYTVTVRTKSGFIYSEPNPSRVARVKPGAPTAVGIQSITIDSVTVTVTLSVGKYDGIQLMMYTEGDTVVSVGSFNLTVLPGVTVRSFTGTVNNLSKPLTPGEQYTARVKTKSGSLVGDVQSPHSAAATVSPSSPIFLSAQPSSGDMSVTVSWRPGNGAASGFYVRIYLSTNTWSKEDFVDYKGKDEYSHEFKMLNSGVFYVTVKSVSDNVNSTSSLSDGVELSAPPVNISVISQSSRSLELKWKRTDVNVKNYRLVVKDGDTCIREVQFVEKGSTHPINQNCTNPMKTVFESKIEFTYNITLLSPYTQYGIYMYLRSLNASEGANPATLNPRTSTEVPSMIVINQTAFGGPRNVKVCWSQPEPFPGPTNYTLTLTDLGETPDSFDPIVIQGYSETCKYKNDLEEFWPYGVTVYASTEAGKGPTAQSKEFRTPAGVPGNVTQLSIKSLPDTLTRITVAWNAPPPRKRNADITGFVLSYQIVGMTNEQANSFNITWSPGNTVYQKDVKVQPGKTYNFTVASHSPSTTGDVVQITYTAPRGPPPIPTGCVITGCLASHSNPARSANTRSFTVEFNPDFFTDKTNGKITDYGLIVVQTKGTDSETKTLTSKYFENFTNWFEAKQQNFEIPHRATPLNWDFKKGVSSRSRRQSNGTFSYIIGADICIDKSDGYCNGPLTPGLDYSVKAFSCTDGGCAETEYVDRYKTTSETEDNNATVITIAVSCSAVVIILLVIIIFIVLRIRRQKRNKSKGGQAEAEGASHEYIPMSPEPDEDIMSSNPIRLSELFDVVEQMHKDSDYLFSRQYAWIKQSSPKLHGRVTAAMLEPNRLKNRYTDILPFDETRVKLLSVEDDEATDYINANYIPGHHSQREYIAAQGPQSNTLHDFWRMIWEQSVHIIVMLTKLEEKGKNKCTQYWPAEEDGPCLYGDVVVEVTSSSTLNTFVLREFKLSVGSTVRRVKQFHYLMWPDFGVSTCEDMVDFLLAVRSHVRPNMQGPMLVHCSAGVGRSGSFIVVDQIREFLKDDTSDSDPTIDIYKIVLTMRHHRPRMVQNESQYIFIHDSVCELVERILQHRRDTEPIYQNQAFEMD